MSNWEKGAPRLWEQWLETAVGAISFRPDRAAAEEELRAHLEDKTADMARMFPDMTQEEAQAMALSQMGEAQELRQALARVHRPWLAYVWMASQIALALALIAFSVGVLTVLGLAWDLVWPEIDYALARALGL